jgi:hypothetical protein
MGSLGCAKACGGAFSQLVRQICRNDSGVLWKAIPHCLMWCERNARTFTGEEKSVPALKFSFLPALFGWLKASNLVSFTSMIEMLDTCSFCA